MSTTHHRPAEVESLTSRDRRAHPELPDRSPDAARRIKFVLAFLLAGGVVVAHAQSAQEPLYLAEVSRAMETMMTDMTIAATGDVDADFVAAMTPHHQGAIAMAQAELAHGKNELLRRIAQGIVVEQAQEIDAMRLALEHDHAR